MARYPIKMLKDENNNPFVPLVSTECVKDPGGQSLDQKIKQYILASHPIGSIEINISGANPSTYLGGTWEQIKDRFLLSAGDTYKAGATGGEATHTLTKSEIPNYTIGDIPEVVPAMHGNWNNGGITATDLGNVSSSKPGLENNHGVLEITSGTQWGYKISTAGGGQPHNNMPPYLVVYVWKRIA